jgi:histidinol-phosphate aminotransferase
MPYERDNIQHMAAYTPGEQPQGETRVVKLNTNENPYPPIEPVMQAIRSLPAEMLRRYPSPAATTFRRTAAKVHGLTPDHVIATNGGDELLRLAVTTFCDPCLHCPPVQAGTGGASSLNPSQAQNVDASSQVGATLPRPLPSKEGSRMRRGIGVCEPSYSLYPILAEAHETPVTRVQLNDDYSIPDHFEDAVIHAGVGLVLIVNPHAPSGTLYDLPRLLRIAQRLKGHAVLLIDEAYVDFADRDAIELLSPRYDLDNVLLLRSMSKGYSLAGLRFGYGLGHANLIAAMDKSRDSYNTDALSQAAATAALEHRDLAAESWRRVKAERSRVRASLLTRGWRVFPSQSNFVLAVPPTEAPPCRDGAPARRIYEQLKSRNILVRYFDLDGLRDKLRITIGTPQENDAVLAALDELGDQRG